MANSPYTLTGDVIVPAGVTLTIESGVQVIAATTDATSSGSDSTRVELISRGTLRVRGTEASPVTFQASTSGSSQWSGVRVESGTATLTSAVIRDAFTGLRVKGSTASATISSSTLHGNINGASVEDEGTLSMDHTVVHDNGAGGIDVRDSSTANLHYNTIVANGPSGVYVFGSFCRVTLYNSIITDHTGHGLSARSGGTMTLAYNNLWNNTLGNYSEIPPDASSRSFPPLFVSSSNFRLTRYSPARKAALGGTSDIGALPYTGDPSPVLAGTIHEDTTLSGALTLAGDLRVATGATLTFAPGTTVTVANSDFMKGGEDASQVELFSRGTLRVLGTRSEPVTFRTEIPAPSPGLYKWRGLRVESSGTATITGALIRDAYIGLDVRSGDAVDLSSSTLSGNSEGVYVSSSKSFSMTRTVVHSSYYSGVSLSTSGSVILDYNTIVDNGHYGVEVSSGTSPGVTLRNSIITGNGSYGVYRSGGTLTLSHNDVWDNSSGNYYNTSAGPNSLSADPLFVSPSHYLLRSISPCRGVSSDKTDIGALPYEERAVASVEVVPDSVRVRAAATTTFIARAYDAAGTPVHDVPFTWSARAEAGTIDDTGLLTVSCTTGTVSSGVTATSAHGVSGSATVIIIPGPAAQVTVTPAAPGLEAGASQRFTADVVDSCGNPSNLSPDWSAAPGSGTISSTGQYTAPCTPGSYPRAVTARAGSVMGTADVSVSTGPLSRLVLLPESPRLEQGAEQAFTAVPTDSCGNTRTDSISWRLANGGGTLDSTTGVFTAGTVPGFYANTIEASVGSTVAQTSVTVLGGPIVSLELSPNPATVGPSGKVTFTATARDASGYPVPASTSWEILEGGGTIDASGVFTAGTVAGTYANTVRAIADGVSATATVIVEPGPAERIELSPSTVRLAPGGTVRFSARVVDAHGNVRTDTVSWRLGSSLAGTLGASPGDFTASTRAGSYPAAIVAESGGLSASASVVIQPGALARLLLSPTSASLQVRESVAFTARGLDAYDNEVPLTPSWEVSGGGGTIDVHGTFTAGTTAGTYNDTVRVSAEGMSASASVVVRPGPVVGVSLTPTNPTLRPLGTQQFSARAWDAFGNQWAASEPTWSAAPWAGTITPTGLFTAGSSTGVFGDAVSVRIEGGVGAATSVTILSPDGPDAGTGNGPDAGVNPQPQEPSAQGCGCSGLGDASAPMMVLLLLALAAPRRRSARA
ncbi:hypothetical protein BO221_02520 [Archangium sp. Cb G35]|nr:hypothetical protein BO221_02520 [Archangium sp. Cb G35]